ncbi:MAG: hypothetical protein TYPL_4590 [Candidatus Tyloplasma litorale]|nr:MAG: hypothetical protein TYPL_4590 [Mycoplasmatales bacterium]
MSEIQKKENINLKNDNANRKTLIYAESNLWKSIFKVTYPVVCLMFIMAAYQILDSIIASRLVTFEIEGSDGIIIPGSYIISLIMPWMLIVMSMISLTSAGFGMVFSQKLGAKNYEEAKECVSTAHIFNIFTSIFSLLLIVCFSRMLSELIINNQIQGDVRNEILDDAYQTSIVYGLAFFVSSFQGLKSRQIRSEGHVKSASFIPIFSIPLNIALDIIFMSDWGAGMDVVGAALATLIGMIINYLITYGYLIYLNKKEETNFEFLSYKRGFNKKIFMTMITIGVVPFVLQIGRTYIVLLTTIMIGKLPSIDHQSWLSVFTGISRPLSLIRLPSLAIMQAGGAFFAYNYGAGNEKRLHKGILVMFTYMVLLALPQWIILLSIPSQIMWLFNITANKEIIIIYETIVTISLFTQIMFLATSYYISTKKQNFALLQGLMIILGYTISIICFHFGFINSEGNEWKFLFFSPTSSIISIIIVLCIFTFVITTEKKEFKKTQISN